jgi:hypothetical protein
MVLCYIAVDALEHALFKAFKTFADIYEEGHFEATG